MTEGTAAVEVAVDHLLLFVLGGENLYMMEPHNQMPMDLQHSLRTHDFWSSPYSWPAHCGNWNHTQLKQALRRLIQDDSKRGR